MCIKIMRSTLLVDPLWWNFICSTPKVLGHFSENFIQLGQLYVCFLSFLCKYVFPPNCSTCVRIIEAQKKMETIILWLMVVQTRTRPVHCTKYRLIICFSRAQLDKNYYYLKIQPIFIISSWASNGVSLWRQSVWDADLGMVLILEWIYLIYFQKILKFASTKKEAFCDF